MEGGEIFMYGKGAYIEKRPVWMLRWGSFLLLGFFMCAIAFTSIFSYNETIKAPVMLTSTDPPVHIKSKRSGRLIDLVPAPMDTVQKGTILGVLEHTGNTDVIIGLRQRLELNRPYADSQEEVTKRFPRELEVGDNIRPYYNRFLNAYYKLLLYRTLGQEEYEDLELRQRLATNTRTIQNKELEIKMSARDLELSKIDFDRHKGLHQKGVVSARELEIKEIGYLRALRQSKALEDQLTRLNQDRSSTINDQLLLSNSRDRNGILLVSELELEREHLLSVLAQWEDLHLLESPIDGRVSFHNIWGEHQNVREGQLVFTVVPIGDIEYLGLCQMPVRNSGKVKTGQRVILKLENYPYREWGSLEGEVKGISDVPGDQGTYMVSVGLEDLKTTFNRTLPFHQEMRGTAEIILDEVTLLQRIFYQFREFWPAIKQ